MNYGAYNTYSQVPGFSYKIIEKLILSEKAELLWKLLKYNQSDAYNKPNLTVEEKAALIYKGEGPEDKFSVFLDYMTQDAQSESKSFLRIYPGEATPTTRTTGVQGINIEIFVSHKINHLSDYTTRVERITQIVLEVLNGADINGVGNLFFNMQGYRGCRISVIGSNGYKGKLIVMAVNVG